MNANIPKPETRTNDAPTEERLAKLTGFNSPSNLPADSSEASTPSPTTSSLLSDEDLEEQITRHSFASSPLSKLVFVAGAVFLVVFLASLFLSQFQSPGESVSAKKPSQTKEGEQNPLLSAENKDKEKEELLSELALREQQERIRDWEAQKTQKSEPTVLKQSEKPVVRTVPVRPTPVRQQVVYQPSRPQTLPVHYQQPVRALPLVSQRRIAPPEASPTDPTQLWMQLSQVGSFGEGRVTIALSSHLERLAPKYEPKTASTKVIANSSQPSETPIPESNPVLSNNYRAISFGQSASAVLETTIAWEGSRSSKTVQTPDDRYIVTLKEPLKDKFGNLEIPEGSQLIIRLEGERNALVTLAAESIIVNDIESKLPPGVLKVRGIEGQPLIAQMTTLGGNDSNDNAQALADVLSIAGDFADIPGSRSISSLYRTLTEEGTRRSGSGITATIFFLREGTPLEVFVNQTFSLDIPEKPLELDFGAIQSERAATELQAENQKTSSERVAVTFLTENPFVVEFTDLTEED